MSEINPAHKAFVKKAYQEAVLKKDTATIDLCLKKGANIDAKLFSGRTALQHAVWSMKDASLVDYILTKNPDLFAKTSDSYKETVFDLIMQIDKGSHPNFRAAMVQKFLNLLPDADRAGNILSTAFKQAAGKAADGTDKPVAVPKKAVFKTKPANDGKPKKGFQR